MTTQAPTGHAGYYADHQALTAAAPGPAWLADLRAAGWERFRQLGFPTARRGNERWKYTAVAPIARIQFASPPASGAADSAGCPAPDFGFPLAPPAFIGNDAENDAALRQHLGRLAPIDLDGFAALNTAFLREVAVVQAPADGPPAAAIVNHAAPIYNEAPAAIHPRTLILAAPNSRLTVIETYGGPPEQRYFSNAVTEIIVGAGAQVDHYRLLNQSAASFHVGVTRVHQSRDSSFSSASFALGTALARNDFAVTLDGPGAFCALNGLYYTGPGQHIDNLISIDHAQPRGVSRLNYKGILDGNSRAVFGGEVLVRRHAQKSDAQQSDKNLLLSENAEVDSKPSLLIYADDVQCSHGATAGQIDAQTLFYLRSRGLDLPAASRMLVSAFAREIVDTVNPEPLRHYLDSLFDRSIAIKALPVAR